MVIDGAGEHKQVGRQCLRDFLGVDGNALARIYSHLKSFRDHFGGDEDYSGGFPGADYGYDLLSVVASSIVIVRKHGWLSKTKANDEGGYPTASMVGDFLTVAGYFYDKSSEWLKTEEYCTTKDEYETAMKVVEWAKGLDPNGPEYLFNLYQMAKKDFVPEWALGLATSMYIAWRKDNESREPKNGKPASQHVGEIGKRQVFNDLKVVMTRCYESRYGTGTIVKFEDPDGNILVWFASGYQEKEYNSEGGKYDIRATIKDHNGFNGTKQTIVTRVKRENELYKIVTPRDAEEHELNMREQIDTAIFLDEPETKQEGE